MAIKHIDRVFEVREDALRIVRELRFLRLLKHANVRPQEPPCLPRLFTLTFHTSYHPLRLLLAAPFRPAAKLRAFLSRWWRWRMCCCRGTGARITICESPSFGPLRSAVVCRVDIDVARSDVWRGFPSRHIVFELFDTDLNHMIRSETRYDMTHRRWVLYQVRAVSP